MISIALVILYYHYSDISNQSIYTMESTQNIAIFGKCHVALDTGSLPHQLETILLIQKRYAFRISEILKLDINSLHPDYNICIKLSKCNDFCFIRDPEYYDLLQVIFKCTRNKAFEVSYKEYYYFLKRYHPDEVLYYSGKNDKVTHSFRHLAVKELKRITKDKKIIQAKLRHKSISSQEYYSKSIPKQSKDD